MQKKERYQRITDYFQQTMPDAQTELQYQSPYQLLVAVMLSAQCTDKRVNMTTPALFQAYPTSQALATATFEEATKQIPMFLKRDAFRFLQFMRRLPVQPAFA